MNTAQLLQHFGRISDAPDAIPRLRRFILDLAVRGRLVEQDSRDEPAEELLKRIQAEKRRFVSEGERKKYEPGPPIDFDEEPFPLPIHWTWARLGEVAELVRGISFSASDKSTVPGPDQLPCFRSGNIQQAIVWANFIYVPRITLKSAAQLVRRNDILISIANSYELVGKSSIVNKVVEEATFGAFLAAIRAHLLSPQFLQVFLSSDYSANAFRIGSAQTTNIANITFGTIRAHIVALPPLAEQHRIVAKVEELMALCDRLETSQAEQESRRNRLVAASLHRMNNGVDADAFRNHSRFYFNQLPRLTTRSEHIQQLRRTILNLAVRGKLVLQGPHDEPASELLERVAVQKRKAGNTKTGRDWVGDIAKPVDEAFVIPKGWAWTRIANTVERVTVGYVGPMKDQYVQDGIPFLRSQNVRANRFREDGLISISPKFHQTISKSALAPGDVVVVRSGNVGTACVIPPSLSKANCSDLVVVKHPIAVHPAYLCFYLNSLASTHIEAGTVGVALTHFNTKSVATMPFPLPPLAEQHRIVAKVDELMALCDRLEAQLTTTQTESCRLLEATLVEALARQTVAKRDKTHDRRQTDFDTLVRTPS